ncbi:MAG: TVP38/TMEM64 family protein [Candidatus Deferrimicrobiota bacterium]
MQPQEKNRVWLKPLIFVAALVAVTVFLYETGLVRFFLDRERMHRFIDSLGAWGFAGFIALQVVQVVAAPIPGEATGLLGGFLYGPLVGTVLSTIGLSLGSYVAFSLSRSFGRPLTDRFVDKSTMNRFDYLLHHKGAFLVFLLFLIPGFPKDILCYILGLGHLTTLEFLTIASTGRLLGTLMLTFGGHFLRDKEYVNLFFLSGIAVVAIFLTIAYKDKLERIFRKWHEKHPRK